MEKTRKLNKRKLKECFVILILVLIVYILMLNIRKTLSRYQSDANANVKDMDIAFWIVDNDFQTQTFALSEVYPNDKPFEYNFSVSNFKDYEVSNAVGSGSTIERLVAETAMEYDISLNVTTNLPVTYELYYGKRKLMSSENLANPISNTVVNELLNVNQSLNYITSNIINTTTTTKVFYRTITASSANNSSELTIGSKENGIIKPETRVYTLKVKFPEKITIATSNNTIQDDESISEDYSDLIESIKLSVSSRQKIS